MSILDRIVGRRRVLLAVCIAAAYSAAFTAQAAETAAVTQSSFGTVVRLSPEDAWALPAEHVIRSEDYQSFLWCEVRAEGLAALNQAGVPYDLVAGGTEISVGEYRFDPLRQIPQIAPTLQSPPRFGGAQMWVVQLTGPVKDEWLDSVAVHGLDRVQYHAENTFAVWGLEQRVEQLGAEAFVRWWGPYHPAYKLAPETGSLTGQVQLSVLVYEPQLSDVLGSLSSMGAQVLSMDAPMSRQRYLEIQIDSGNLVPVARLDGVLAVNAGTRQPIPMDEMGDKISAGMVNGSAPQSIPPTYKNGFLTPQGVDGDGVVVHINDTGVYEQHDDLSGRMDAEYGNQAHSHGTHVAGIVLGEGYNGIGDLSSGGSWIYGLGVAPDAHYVDEYFTCSPSTCTYHAEINDANISSNSWGYASGGSPNCGYGYTANSKTWDRLVQDANTQESGAQLLSIVSAAGNCGPSSEQIIEPWEAKNVVSVAASRNWRNSTGYQGYGNINDIASFSSRGYCKDGRICPVITAPGRYVISARYGTSGCGYQKAPNSSTHSVCSGTSMATPHVSGASALITEWWRDNHSGATPGPAMIKALLVNGAMDMGTANIPNASEGWGRVNVADSIDPPTDSLYWDRPTVLHSTGNTWSVEVVPDDTSEAMKVSLVWTDDQGPGTGGGSAAWVNNLNLKLQKGSTIWWGNNFSNGWSVSGGSSDAKNNVENVYLSSPSSGIYTLKVIAANIAGDGVLHNGDPTDSSFALVCQNCTLSTATATPTNTPSGSPVPTRDMTSTPTATQSMLQPSATPTPTIDGLRPTPTPYNSPTSAPTATSTLEPPTETASPTASATPSPTVTSTPVPPTATNTPVPPTATWTATSTWTASATATSTAVPPTATDTPVPPTATRTATSTWTASPTATSTAVPPTVTNTPVPPTATNTPEPPTATLTATDTATPTATKTALPATATFTPEWVTATPIGPTATSTRLYKWTPSPTLTATATRTVTPTVTPTPTATVPPEPTKRPYPFGFFSGLMLSEGDDAGGAAGCFPGEPAYGYLPVGEIGQPAGCR